MSLTFYRMDVQWACGKVSCLQNACKKLKKHVYYRKYIDLVKNIA